MPTHQVFDLILMIKKGKIILDSFTYLRKSVTWGAVENSEGIPISYRRKKKVWENESRRK